MKSLRTLALSAAGLAAAAVSAMTLNPALYEGFAQGPGGVVAISAKRSCSIDHYAKAGWKRARFFRGEGDIGLDGCWKRNTRQFRGAVDVCLIDPNDKAAFKHCAPTDERDFVLTSSLPKPAF